MKLLKFETATCGPCRMMSPIVEAVTSKLSVAVEKIDASSDPRAAAFGVTSVPTLVVVDNHGNELARHIGVMPKPHLEKWLSEFK